MFERFTDRARRVLVLAQEEARLLKHSYIGTEHVLLGLMRESEGIAAKALEEMNVTLDEVRRSAMGLRAVDDSRLGSPPLTLRAKKALELSFDEVLQLHHDYIGTEHILLGLLRVDEGVAVLVLSELGVDLAETRAKVMALLETQSLEERQRPPVTPSRLRTREDDLGGLDPSAARTALDLPGTWPTTKKARANAFQPLDLDRCAGFALVLAADKADCLSHYLFLQKDGEWHLQSGGSGGGNTFAQRAAQPWIEQTMTISFGSRSRRDEGTQVCYVAILCAPKVGFVYIQREEPRRAEVSRGPGHVAILWTAADEPSVTAFDSDGSQIGVLGPDELNGFLDYPFSLPPRRGPRRFRR